MKTSIEINFPSYMKNKWDDILSAIEEEKGDTVFFESSNGVVLIKIKKDRVYFEVSKYGGDSSGEIFVSVDTKDCEQLFRDIVSEF